MAVDRASDFGLLKETAREAAKLALSYWRRPLTTERKADGTAVTEADFAVDALFARRLKEARPDYGWLSEESAEHDRRLAQRRIWALDPIDGTRAFIKGNGDWSIALALIEEGVPVLAVVVNPVRKETFEASLAGGAYLNGKRIHADNRTELTGARIVASDGVLKMPIWRDPWPALAPVWANSLAYRLALVACGKIDAAFALTRKWEWDIAAGALLVSEAGGVVSAASGRPLLFNTKDAKVEGFLAAGPELYQTLIERLSGAAAEMRLASGRRI